MITTLRKHLSFEEYAARGRNAWPFYLLTPLVAVAVTVLLSIVAALVLALTRAPINQLMDEMQQPKHPVPFFVGAALSFGLLLLGFLGGARIVQAKRPGDLLGAWSWGRFAAGAAIWAVLAAAAAGIDYLIAPQGFSVTASEGTKTLAIAALIGLSIQTFTEEIIFRGWLTQGLLLATKRRVLPAAILSGLLFGAAHIPNGAPQAVSAAIFGVFTALIAIRTGGIAFTYGVHLANNLFGAVVLISGDDVFKGAPGLFSQHTPGLDWWDVAAEGVCLVIVLLLIFSRRRTDIPTSG
jgi:membrane protease YdiL (CAAX protease family)